MWLHAKNMTPFKFSRNLDIVDQRHACLDHLWPGINQTSRSSKDWLTCLMLLLIGSWITQNNAYTSPLFEMMPDIDIGLQPTTCLPLKLPVEPPNVAWVDELVILYLIMSSDGAWTCHGTSYKVKKALKAFVYKNNFNKGPQCQRVFLCTKQRVSAF